MAKFKKVPKTSQEREQRKARKLYKFLFGEEFPKDAEIWFGLLGLTNERGGQIWITADNLGDAIETTIHEFVHWRNPHWRHGRKFDKEVKRLFNKVVKWK